MGHPELREPEAGPTWAQRAELDTLAAVLDPGDSLGRKNLLIDAVHKHALDRAIGSTVGRRVLDFGCGTGRIAAWLTEKGADVDGIDVTPAMLEAARRVAPRARFHQVEGTVLPFDDQVFDVIVSVYVLQYYVDRGFAAVAGDFGRVLRPGGRVVAIEQVVSGELGRGGTLAEYCDGFRRARFDVVDVEPVRAGASRVLEFGQRHTLPGVARWLPALARLEARRRVRRLLPPGQYVDMLFIARRQ